MNNKRFDMQKQSQSDLVYDPEYDTWDKLDNAGDVKVDPDVKKRHSRISKIAKGIGIIALAGGISYGGVHAAADFAGAKAGSFGIYDVTVPALLHDLVVDVPTRLTKGF